MFERVTSDIHDRRQSRNLGVAACLVGFIVLLFALTAVKVQQNGMSQAFDHVVRPEMIPEPNATGGQ